MREAAETDAGTAMATARRAMFGRGLATALDAALDDPAALRPLWSVFTRGEPVDRADLAGVLPPDVLEAGVVSGLLDEFDVAGTPWLRSTVCVVAVEVAGVLRWIASDFPWQDGEERYVGGPGNATETLLRVVDGIRWTGTAIDQGTGAGAVAVALAAAGHDVVAADANPRAVVLAELTAALNGVDLRVGHGDYTVPVSPAVDLWVANPAFVLGAADDATLFRDNPGAGSDQVVTLAGAALRSLRPGGVAVLLGNWEYGAGDPLADLTARLRAELGGASFVLHERAVVDPLRYAAVWTPDPARQRAWAARIEAGAVRAIGTGILALRADGAASSRVERSLDQPQIDLSAAVLGDWRDRGHF